MRLPWGMMPVYLAFGLTEFEIQLIAGARMKHDYFYTSPLGRRLFSLDLGPLTLALIGSADHAALDALAQRFRPGCPLCADILDAKGFNPNRYLAADAPVDPLPLPRQDALPPVTKTQPQEQKLKEVEKENTAEGLPKPQEFFDALLSLPDRKKSNGAGRAAQAVSKRFAVSLASIYQARKVLKSGSPGLVEAMRSNSIPVKTAYKKLFAELHGENEYVQ